MASGQGRQRWGWAMVMSSLSLTLGCRVNTLSQTGNPWRVRQDYTMCRWEVFRCPLHNLYWFTGEVRRGHPSNQELLAQLLLTIMVKMVLRLRISSMTCFETLWTCSMDENSWECKCNMTILIRITSWITSIRTLLRTISSKWFDVWVKKRLKDDKGQKERKNPQ